MGTALLMVEANPLVAVSHLPGMEAGISLFLTGGHLLPKHYHDLRIAKNIPSKF